MVEQDQIYAVPHERTKEFVFDETVAQVFEDMISRSVPGYSSIVSNIGVIAQRFVSDDSRIYDLGCSLGACSLVMNQMVTAEGCRLVAVDNSPSMVAKCIENFDKAGRRFPVDVIESDLFDVEIQNASMVVLNFTLQFIEQSKREDLLKKIYAGLKPGGVLVLSEKLQFELSKEQDLMTELHHDFKRANGYSDLEIAQKRAAIENVLIPETMGEHVCRLEKVGFSEVYNWYRCLNFTSFLAVK